MSKVIGVARNDFQIRGTDTQVTGVNIYLSDPIDLNKGKGLSTEKIYLTDRKISDNRIDVDSLLGKQVRVLYNRFGKVEAVETLP